MLITHWLVAFNKSSAIVAIADDATHQRQLEFKHYVPRHGHDV
jgi:hypothetical protein